MRKWKKKAELVILNFSELFAQPPIFSPGIHDDITLSPVVLRSIGLMFCKGAVMHKKKSTRAVIQASWKVDFSVQRGQKNKVGRAVVFEQSQPLLSTSCFLAAVLTVWTMATVAAQLSLRETRRWAASCTCMYTMGQDGALDWLQSSVLLTAQSRSD